MMPKPKSLGWLSAAILVSVAALGCRKADRPAPAQGQAAAFAFPRSAPIPRKDAFFGLHFDLHPQATDTSLGADISEDNIRGLLERVKPDYVQYDCKGHAGWTGYPTAVGWASPGIVKDSLAVWRKATRDVGVGLFIHYSGVWDSKAVAEHPDWARVGPDGKPDPNATSVFGPYVDELLIPQLNEVAQKYGLDGVWADGECWGAQLDWSPRALAAWTKETGHRDAPKDRTDPRWLDWKMFHRRAFERYLAHWTDAVHAANPALQLTSNWMYTTFAPKPVEAKLDFLSGDYSPSLSVDRARVEARYLASTGMPWDLMAWGFDKGQDLGLVDQAGRTPDAGGVRRPDAGRRVPDLPHAHAFGIPRRAHHRPGGGGRRLLPGAAGREPQVDERAPGRPAPVERELLGPVRRRLRAVGRRLPRSSKARSTPCSTSTIRSTSWPSTSSSRASTEFPLVVVPDSHRLTAEFRRALTDYVERGGSLLLLGEKCARLFEPMLGAEFDGAPAQRTAELRVGRRRHQRRRRLAEGPADDGPAAGFIHPDPGRP